MTRCLLWVGRKQQATAALGGQKWRHVVSSSSSGSGVVRWMSSDDYPAHEVMGMPALSPTMEVGTIGSWKVEEGAAFGPGDVLAEIETDKATMDFEAQEDGVLVKILQPSGSADISVGTPIALISEDDDIDLSLFANYQVADSEPTTPVSDAAPSTATADVERQVPLEHVLTPAARHISQSKGLDATGLAGTGKGGRITKGDVLQAMAAGVTMPTWSKATTTTAATPAAAAPVAAVKETVAAPVAVSVPEIEGMFEDVPNNNMRKVIAKRLTESKSQVPHFYTTVQIALDEVLKLRKTLPVKVSVNDVIVRAAALALRDVPEINLSDETVDVSIAVATPGGLITPIVPQTHTLGLHEINTKISDLASRARDNKLKPEEYQGGTFCISNLGMFGITEFSAVINPPQGAILAVGGGIPTVVPSTDPNDKAPKIQTLMTARLSADRSKVDEPTASLFLQTLQRYLSQPHLLVL